MFAKLFLEKSSTANSASVTLLQKWVRICFLWQAGLHQTVFWSRCWDDVVSGLTRPRGRSYTGETICVQIKVRLKQDAILILFESSRCETLRDDTNNGCRYWGGTWTYLLYLWCNMFLPSFDYWLTQLLFCLWRYAGMQCLPNGSQAPKMALFVYGYVICDAYMT